MPTLRWFGRRFVTSLPSIRIVPAVGLSKPATMRKTVVLPQPDGPSSERNSPPSMPRLKPLTTMLVENCLRTSLISRKAMLTPGPISRRALQLPRLPEHIDQAHAGPGDQEGDDCQRRGLIGPVGADQLQIGTEGRPVQKAGHGELADDDREGQERTGEDRDPDVREDHLEQDGRQFR